MRQLHVLLVIILVVLSGIGGGAARSRHNGNGLNYSTAVFIGTSITLGVRPGVTADQTIPYLVGRAKGYVPSVDAGVGGNTSTQLLARFDHDVLSLNPSMISIEAGTNDPGAGISVETFTSNVETMIQRALRSGARVTLFVSPYTVGALDAEIEPYRVAMRSLASTYGTDLFDTYDDFVALPSETQTAYFNGDGMHFSPAGLAWCAGLVGSGAYANSFAGRVRLARRAVDRSAVITTRRGMRGSRVPQQVSSGAFRSGPRRGAA